MPSWGQDRTYLKRFNQTYRRSRTYRKTLFLVELIFIRTVCQTQFLIEGNVELLFLFSPHHVKNEVSVKQVWNSIFISFNN